MKGILNENDGKKSLHGIGETGFGETGRRRSKTRYTGWELNGFVITNIQNGNHRAVKNTKRILHRNALKCSLSGSVKSLTALILIILYAKSVLECVIRCLLAL